MPRIFTSDNDPLDFCQDCLPPEAQARDQFANRGPGPDGRGNCFGYMEDHPDYEGEGYKCTSCGKELLSEDN